MNDEPEVMLDKDDTDVPVSDIVVSNENDPDLGEYSIIGDDNTEIVENESVNPDENMESRDHGGLTLTLRRDQLVILQQMHTTLAEIRDKHILLKEKLGILSMTA